MYVCFKYVNLQVARKEDFRRINGFQIFIFFLYNSDERLDHCQPKVRFLFGCIAQALLSNGFVVNPTYCGYYQGSLSLIAFNIVFHDQT